ncbi:MAG: tRNA (adenosine(37)-N6)-threonylcarbamoyltransferase complex dimerization subunit type 1 TsaB [Erysipelotrichaceae bacterium]|nr:tRNA (adenosine(37)-N6)-threonylcarbamoyltransferase complex dimerization subunit type 1 TsaB [Erysipelotrichaceae bacterium]
MLSLCLDTAHKYLVVGLIQDDKVIYRFMEECWKKQSEMIMPVIDKAFKDCGLKPTDIDEIVISVGPGSFTGVRIALTIAKVLGSVASIPIYTLSTLQLYAGLEDALVLLDARSSRAYVGRYKDFVGEDQILSIDQVKALVNDKIKIIGDGSLLGLTDHYPDIVSNFALLRPYYHKVENIHLLAPVYLKASSEYQANI